MTQLIDDLPHQQAPRPEGRGAVRLRQAERRQVGLQAVCLDDLIDHDHLARLVWQVAGTFDLQPLLDRVEAREGAGGQPHTDPHILVALWLYATLDGVGSARELARLCEAHAAYRWICGGVSLNHHTLSDFRVGHADWLDRELVRSIASLLAARQISLDSVAQDGVRVRASAGSASFRRAPRLTECMRLAAARVAQVRDRLHDEPGTRRSRSQAAQQRAAAERLANVQKAMDELDEAQARKQRSKGKPEDARVSTTDPQARIMKMPDGGFRPAYNVQFCASVDGGLVVGVGVTNSGADQNALSPMQRKIRQDYGMTPGHVLADAGFTAQACIQDVHAAGSLLHMPVGRNAPKSQDEAVVAWRARMQTEESKAQYAMRGRTIEWVNAGARNRGFTAVNVRGMVKVRAVALWQALAHNLSRMVSLPGLLPA